MILLDFSLKDTKGGAWCAELKGSAEFADIPVVIFSAYSNNGIAKGAYGCDDFIAKLFDLDDLIARIKRLTDKELRSPKIEHKVYQTFPESAQIIKPI